MKLVVVSVLYGLPRLSKVDGPEIAVAHGPKSGWAMARPAQ